MRTDFQLYIRGSSWLHRMDPRVKLAFVVVATMLAFLWPYVWMQIALILVCLLLLWSAAVPGQRIARLWRNMGIVLILVFVLSALFAGGDSAVVFTLGPLQIRVAGIQQGALLASRLMALAMVFAVWLYTTDQTDMVRGFVALQLPYEWGLTLALAFRYLPTFGSLYARIVDAQQARGLDLESGAIRERLQAYQPILIALVVSALRHSEALGWALEARGLGTTLRPRTVFKPLRMRRLDWLVLGVLTALLVGGTTLRVL
jgi:energy-coupling factor transport system permease protein